MWQRNTVWLNLRGKFHIQMVHNRGWESEYKADFKAQVDTEVGVTKGKKEKHVLLLEPTNLSACFHLFVVIVLMLCCVWLFATPWTIACQAPLSMGFSKQEYWSRLPFPASGIFLTQRSNSRLLCLLHCRQVLYHWATREALPRKLKDVNKWPNEEILRVRLERSQTRDSLSLQFWLWHPLS